MAGITAGSMEYEGKVNRMSDGVASPTSVLVQEDVIGSWDSATNSPSRQDGARPHERHSKIFDYKAGAQAMEPKLCSRDVESSPTSQSTSRFLVETLQTCLTSIPLSTKNMSTASGCQPWKNASSMPSRGSPGETNQRGLALAHGACMGEESMEAAQTSNLNRLTTVSHSVGVTTTKVTKRRRRASRRVPTTVLDADPSNFQDLVQRLTCIDAAKPERPVLRPQAKRPASRSDKVKQPPPNFQGPDNSQTHAYGIQAPGSRIQQNLNFTKQIQQPSCNNNRTQSSNYTFKRASSEEEETMIHASGSYTGILVPSTSRTPTTPPPPPLMSSSSLTGLMYQPEEVTAFVNTVNTPATTTTTSSSSQSLEQTSELNIAAMSSYTSSSSSWEQQNNLENKAIRPARIDTASFTSAMRYDVYQLAAEDEISYMKASSNSSRLEDHHHHHHHHSLSSNSYLQRPDSFDQEEIDSWFMSC